MIGVVVKNFLNNLAIEPPGFPMTNQALEEAMRMEMVTRNLQCPQLERTLHPAASLVEVGVPDVLGVMKN